MERVDEKALIAQVLRGDRQAARALYDAHAPRVYRVTYRLVGDAVLAEELTQDTFVKAFTRLSDFRGEAALGTWIHSIAVSMGLNALRRIKRIRSRETDLESARDVEASSNEADPDLRDRLTGAIDGLPEKFRIMVVLHDVEGFTHLEIATMTGVPVGTCKTRLMLARAKLREELAAFAR
jgi:RNA polymerase sigma-70 factor (ECF subfamily)